MCFFLPFFAVAITFKQYFLTAYNVFADDVHDGDFFFLAFFYQCVYIFLEIAEGFGHDTV